MVDCFTCSKWEPSTSYCFCYSSCYILKRVLCSIFSMKQINNTVPQLDFLGGGADGKCEHCKVWTGEFHAVLLLILLNYLNIRIQTVYHNGVPNLMNCTEGIYFAMRFAFQTLISLQCPPCILFPAIFMFPGVLRLVYWVCTLSPFLLCLFKSWRTCVLVLQVPKALN
jgi:hypothetical protein